jgi:hypothetical protein
MNWMCLLDLYDCILGLSVWAIHLFPYLPSLSLQATTTLGPQRRTQRRNRHRHRRRRQPNKHLRSRPALRKLLVRTCFVCSVTKFIMWDRFALTALHLLSLKLQTKQRTVRVCSNAQLFRGSPGEPWEDATTKRAAASSQEQIKLPGQMVIRSIRICLH